MTRGGPARTSERGPSLLLVAHGTRDRRGVATAIRLADRVRAALPGVAVQTGFADVCAPTVADTLATLPGPVLAVPMFLGSGYHVRVDVPAQLAATGRDDVVLADSFGPDPLLVAAAASRLRAAGWRRGDAVVLGVAGSSDPRAALDSADAAAELGHLLGTPVSVATIAAGGPRIGDVVAGLRAGGASRVAVASWLLAPGLFQGKLDECGADVVATPLAVHPAVVAVALARYRSAHPALVAA